MSKNVRALYVHVNFNKSRWRLIDKNFTYSTPMGYCYCDTHKGYISNNLAVTHNCLHKNKGEKCPFLKVNEDLRNYNQFISDKEKDKHKKELYKRLRKLYYDNTIKFNEYNRYQKLISKGIPVNDILDKLERKYKKKELI